MLMILSVGYFIYLTSRPLLKGPCLKVPALQGQSLPLDNSFSPRAAYFWGGRLSHFQTSLQCDDKRLWILFPGILPIRARITCGHSSTPPSWALRTEVCPLPYLNDPEGVL